MYYLLGRQIGKQKVQKKQIHHLIVSEKAWEDAFRFFEEKKNFFPTKREEKSSPLPTGWFEVSQCWKCVQEIKYSMCDDRFQFSLDPRASGEWSSTTPIAFKVERKDWFMIIVMNIIHLSPWGFWMFIRSFLPSLALLVPSSWISSSFVIRGLNACSSVFVHFVY